MQDRNRQAVKLLPPKVNIRTTRDKDNAICSSCGATRGGSLEIYDIRVGSVVFSVCDRCNEVLFNKVLKAQVDLQGRVRTPNDQRVIRERTRLRLGEGKTGYGSNFDF